ncbi:MAG: hypothetical protein ACOZF0_12080 [Thermodesulfobacteriota bacterium]
MQANTPAVDHLQKILLEVRAGGDPETPAPTGTQVEFVFGVGSCGLAPIESSLQGRKAGDELDFRLLREEIRPFLGHLFPVFAQLPLTAETLHLSIRIESVRPAGDREIVKALAGNTACGDGCDCGCGH